MTGSARRPATRQYAPSATSSRFWWIPVLQYQRHLTPGAWYGTLVAGALSLVSGLLALGRLISSRPENSATAAALVAAVAAIVSGVNARRVLHLSRANIRPHTESRSGRIAVAAIAANQPNLVRCPSTGEHIESVAEIDQWLYRNPAPKIACVELQQHQRPLLLEELRRESQLHARILWTTARLARAENLRFDNEDKIVLRTDLQPGVDRVEVTKGSYFTSFLLNERSNRDYVRIFDEKRTPLSDAGAYFTDRVTAQGALLPTARVRTSPHLGANLLAIGSDGHLVLWEQVNAVVASDHTVPSGSGSLDWMDLRSDLLATVRAGAEREFLEESHRKGAPVMPRIEKMKVVGYFRLVDRSCLPGFALLARLRVPVTDLVPNVSEVRELWGADLLRARTPAELSNTIRRLFDADEALNLPPISTPLFAVLRCVDAWLNDPNARQDVAAFFDEP